MELANQYASERVGKLAEYLLSRTLQNIGYQATSDEQVAISIRYSGLKDAARVFTESFVYTHQGMYGPLSSEYQKKLNMLMGVYTITGRSGIEKSELICEIVNENDKVETFKREMLQSNKTIAEIIKDTREWNDNFLKFIDKVDHLYVLEKNSLRLRIQDGKEYELALADLNGIFQKCVEKARVRLEKDSEVNQSPMRIDGREN